MSRSPYLVASIFVLSACSPEAQGPSPMGQGGAPVAGTSNAGAPSQGGSGQGGSSQGGTSGMASGGTSTGGSGDGGTANGGTTAGAGGTTAGAAGNGGGGAVAGSGGTQTGGAAGTSGAGGTTAGAGGEATAGAGGTSGAGGTGDTGGTAGSGGEATGGSSGGMPSGDTVTDDFEGAMLDPAKWEIGGNGQGTIELSTEQAHGGQKSVKVVVMNGQKLFINKSLFPLPNGVIHFRVWMRFTNDNWQNHIAFVAAGPGPESQEVRFGGQAGYYHANLAEDGDGLSPNPFVDCDICVPPVANTWVCLRGMFDFTNDDARLFVDDELAVDAKDSSDWHSGNGNLPENPAQIGFGWALYGGSMTTVYYDDIAIGYEPIACN